MSAPRTITRWTEPKAVSAARSALYAEFAAYSEVAEARETIRRPADQVTRWQMANAIRVLRTGDGIDAERAGQLARACGISEREIARTAQPAIDWQVALTWLVVAASMIATGVWGIPLFLAAIRWGGEWLMGAL